MVLRIKEHSAVELIAEHGSPLHVVDEQVLREDVAAFVETLRSVYSPIETYYSYKTNPVPAVLERLRDLEVGAEVISAYEYWLARRLGVPGERIVVNGIGKTSAYVEAVVAGGCRAFNLDHVDELTLLERAHGGRGPKIAAGIRLVGEGEWGAQFGVEPHQVLELADALSRSDAAYFAGLHMHVSTNAQLPRVYTRGLERITALCAQLHARGHRVEYLDIGGGFPVPGVNPLGFRERASLFALNRMPPTALRRRARSLREHAGAIGRAMSEVVRALAGDRPALLLEPGRALSSRSHTLLLRVNAVKRRPDGTRYAITDAGPHGVAHPMLFEEHPIALVGRDTSEPPVAHTLVGPTCSPPDILAHAVRLPPLRAGDILAVFDSGAYFTSLEANFGFEKPAIVMVDTNGEVTVARRRETFEDLVARDLSPGSRDS